MRVLFVSRKKKTDVGGLARFATELISRFPNAYLLSPDNLFTFIKLPFLHVDLIHLCDATLLPLGVLLKFILRKPLTLTAHGLDLTFSHPMYQLMLNKTLPQVDVVILDSEAAKSDLARLGVEKEKLFVIHPGISINHLNHSTSVKLPNIAGKIVLVTVGNLVLRKGHAWFIKNVFVRLSDEFVYLIVGDGSEKTHIQWFINKFHLAGRVFLLGRLANSQLRFVFDNSNAYVCPNRKIAGDFEGFGIAAGEAAAMGLPVIVSRVDGLEAIIKHGKNGLLVKPDASSFLAAMKKLTNKTARQNIGKKAKTYTRTHFSWEQTAKSYLTVFAKEIRKKKASPQLSSPM